MTWPRLLHCLTWGPALLVICVLTVGTSVGEPLGLRVDWRSDVAARGSVISGYVFNDNGTTVSQVLLRVDGLDETGAVVSTSTGYVFGTVPAFNRTYFEVSVPTASSYRVAVSSFQWMKGGGGGGGM